MSLDGYCCPPVGVCWGWALSCSMWQQLLPANAWIHCPVSMYLKHVQ
jgi:hypothetical protein